MRTSARPRSERRSSCPWSGWRGQFGGATVIGVTHPPKRDNRTRAIGSAQLENLAYAVLRVAKKADGLVRLTVAAMKDGPAGPEQVVTFRVQGGKDRRCRQWSSRQAAWQGPRA